MPFSILNKIESIEIQNMWNKMKTENPLIKFNINSCHDKIHEEQQDETKNFKALCKQWH